MVVYFHIFEHVCGLHDICDICIASIQCSNNSGVNLEVVNRSNYYSNYTNISYQFHPMQAVTNQILSTSGLYIDIYIYIPDNYIISIGL